MAHNLAAMLVSFIHQLLCIIYTPIDCRCQLFYVKADLLTSWKNVLYDTNNLMIEA
jgi:hypothetical protein